MMSRVSQFIWYINQSKHNTHHSGSGWTRWKKDNIKDFDPDTKAMREARKQYRSNIK